MEPDLRCGRTIGGLCLTPINVLVPQTRLMEPLAQDSKDKKILTPSGMDAFRCRLRRGQSGWEMMA